MELLYNFIPLHILNYGTKNAGSSGTPGVLNITSVTGSPMVLFLVAGPHEDEALDMKSDFSAMHNALIVAYSIFQPGSLASWR